MHITEILDSIRAFASERNLSASGLALLAGLNRGTLRGFQGQNWNPTAETIRAIQNVMGIK